MYETQLTVVGRLTTEVDGRRLNSGATVANFRIASTERRYDQAAAGWVDGDTLYMDVRCWRGLAENAIRSLNKGDPVVVTGRVFTRDYEHQGQRRTAVTLEARSVAADLAHCTVVLTRTRRGAQLVHSRDDDRSAVGETVDAVEDCRNRESDADASATVGAQPPPTTDGARPSLVSVAPGDEG
jgi:single-strand DNA-binding protein